MSNAPLRIKRFYTTVSVEASDKKFVVTLDGCPAKTKMSHPLAAPTMPLAQAIADEWKSQAEFIERISMPMTAMLTAAIDAGEGDAKQWRQDVLNYLGSDLVCYRAHTPKALVQRQCAAWDPYLDFLVAEFDATLVTTSGVVAVSQPAAAISSVRCALDGLSAETLFALRTATAITGSCALSLALWKNHREAEAVFNASRIDEQYQEESWGIDDEARARADHIRDEFLTVGQFLSLL